MENFKMKKEQVIDAALSLAAACILILALYLVVKHATKQAISETNQSVQVTRSH
jgi:hypothetical protein